ncbi:Esterase/lipase [Candidatus Paraburkholderia schumanniana]|nr:Esterase/lipase [Candidatus Paraburkholderia schumannianae]
MTIDATLLRFRYYRGIAEAYQPAPPDAGARTVRERFSEMAKAYALPRGDAIAAEDIEIPLAGRTLVARLYKPKAARGSLPLIVYFHGGSWVGGISKRTMVLSSGWRWIPNARWRAWTTVLRPSIPFPRRAKTLSMP